MNSKRKLIVHENAKSPIAEAFRTLRTNIHFAKVDGELHTLMFTSTGPAEGKSTVAANTAVAIAQSGKTVVIVDCDLRKPVQHHIFDCKNRGVTNILVEDIDPIELLQETAVENLKLLPSGPIPPNPSELLSSVKMGTLITTLREQADVVIIDAPPAIAVTDACVLASRVDGILLVIGSGITRPEMAQQARDLLQKAQGKILGAILNRVEITKDHYYYYYYYGDEGKKKIAK